jgi:ribosomal protein L37AE/L43A
LAETLLGKSVSYIKNATAINNDTFTLGTNCIASSQAEVDAIQKQALEHGFSADFKHHEGKFYVSINRSATDNRPMLDAEEARMVPFSGKVYCLEVPGNILYVRRNGKPVWCGNSRGSGPLVMLTRQPAEGRARDGGLRFGEMERDCVAAHAATEFLKEIMMEKSDNFQMHVCKSCGLIGQVNPKSGIYRCTSCENTTDFAQVRVPYAYKLFLQELESMSICSRIIVESKLRTLAHETGQAPKLTISEIPGMSS